jgi:hypothetical protein
LTTKHAVEATTRIAFGAARIARRRLATLVGIADGLFLLGEVFLPVASATSDDDERENRKTQGDRCADTISARRTKRRKIRRPAVVDDATHGAPPYGEGEALFPSEGDTIFSWVRSRTLF